MELNTSFNFLIVDDFELMRKMLQHNLYSLGFKKVVLANDGDEAVKILKNQKVDCIISDWNMPGRDGLQLLQYVRSNEKYQNIPFMMVTAEGERNMVNKAIALGVDQFLIKPFTQANLRDKITAMFKHGARIRAERMIQQPGDIQIETHPYEHFPGHEKPSILIVDDAPANVDVLAEVLKNHYQIKAANSGHVAIKICNTRHPPDLILLDIMMPDMNGYEVCQILKSHPETAHIPIIFLSAKSETIDMKKGFDVGAVDYIIKPCNQDILRARVATHIKLKLSHDALEERVDALVENANLRADVERITRHDLKNPLAAIIGTCDVIPDYQSLTDISDAVDDIREASMTMLSMINRSLDIYKIETGTYQPTLIPMDLAKVIGRLVHSFQSGAHRQTIEITCHAPEPCLVMGEEMLCISLFSNLLNNAIEASPPQSTINVSVKSLPTVCQVTIHNPGHIPEDIQDTLFEKYVTHGKQGGTGLGTYSAKLMTETQQGSIRFETDEQTGTTFFVDLPKALSTPSTPDNPDIPEGQ